MTSELEDLVLDRFLATCRTTANPPLFEAPEGHTFLLHPNGRYILDSDTEEDVYMIGPK